MDNQLARNRFEELNNVPEDQMQTTQEGVEEQKTREPIMSNVCCACGEDIPPPSARMGINRCPHCWTEN